MAILFVAATAAATAAVPGSRLALRTLPQPAPAAVLEGVSCTSTTFCMAVGGYGSGQASPAFISRWDGHSWRIVSRPMSNGFGLNSVACVSSSFCLAVGQDERNRTLAERWNGHSWARIGAASFPGSESDALNTVSCLSATSCWGVGNINGFTRPPQTVVEHYGRGGWRAVSAPRLGTALTGISCASARFCIATAVGGTALRYDGHSWHTFHLPGVFDTNNRVWVGCKALNACWLVGVHGHTGQAIGAHLVGGSWKVVHMPMGVSQGSSTPQDVECSSASHCVVVGANQVLHGSPPKFTVVGSAFVEEWDGTAWHVVPSSGGAGAFLQGVSCPLSTWCKAVGGDGRRAVVGTATFPAS